MSSRNQIDTLTRASRGQGRNQLIWVQLMRPGNRRHRVRKTSPTGEKHRTTCRFARTLFVGDRHAQTATKTITMFKAQAGWAAEYAPSAASTNEWRTFNAFTAAARFFVFHVLCVWGGLALLCTPYFLAVSARRTKSRLRTIRHSC